jgi:hypothetical protein
MTCIYCGGIHEVTQNWQASCAWFQDKLWTREPDNYWWTSDAPGDRIKAWWLGFRDGIAEPYDLGSGITWAHDDRLSEVYDRGANWGQRIGKILRRNQ